MSDNHIEYVCEFMKKYVDMVEDKDDKNYIIDNFMEYFKEVFRSRIKGNSYDKKVLEYRFDEMIYNIENLLFEIRSV